MGRNSYKRWSPADIGNLDRMYQQHYSNGKIAKKYKVVPTDLLNSLVPAKYYIKRLLRPTTRISILSSVVLSSRTCVCIFDTKKMILNFSAHHQDMMLPILPTDLLSHISTHVPREYYLCSRLVCKAFNAVFRVGGEMRRHTYMRTIPLMHFALDNFDHAFFSENLLEDAIPFTNVEVVRALIEIYTLIYPDPTNENRCAKAAKYGNLDLLILFRTYDCEWTQEVLWNACRSGTMASAPIENYLNIVKYAIENDCPYNRDICMTIATSITKDNIIAEYIHAIG